MCHNSTYYEVINVTYNLHYILKSTRIELKVSSVGHNMRTWIEFWLDMKTIIKDTVSKPEICNISREQNVKESLKPYIIPDHP